VVRENWLDDSSVHGRPLKILMLQLQLRRSQIVPISLMACAATGALATVDAQLSAAAIGAAGLVLLLMLRPVIALGVLFFVGGVDLAATSGGEKTLFASIGGVDLSGIRLVTSVVGMATLIAVRPASARQQISLGYVVPLALFVAYGACTLLWSPVPAQGFRLLAKILYFLLVFVAVQVVCRSKEDVDKLLAVALVGGAIVATVVNPIVWWSGGFDEDTSGITRLRGGGIHENPASFYMLILLLLVLARFQWSSAWVWIGLSVAFAVSMLLAYTRVTQIALVAAILTMELVRRRTRDHARRWLALLLMLVVPVAALPVLAARSFANPDELFADLPASVATDSSVSPLETVNLQGRELIWAITWERFSESPIFGGGLGAAGDRLATTLQFDEAPAPHNEYLRMLADTGVVGTLLLVVALAVWVKATLHVLRTNPGDRRHDLARAALGGLVAFAVIAWSDNPLDYYASFTQFMALYTAGCLRG
jgi:O-antigen ligase